MILANHGIVSSSGGIPPSTLLTNLYAVYKAENNANDSLGTYNGTAQGGLTYTTGKSGNAFTFNGTNAFVNLTNNSLNFNGDFSISIWVNFASFNAENCIISNYYEAAPFAGNSRGWFTYMDRSNLYWIIAGSTQAQLIVSLLSFLNTWGHLVITFKSGVGSKIYKNGTLVSSNSSTVTPLYHTTHSPSIGCYKYGNTNIQGILSNGSKVDELNVWNKELTVTEVTELYNAGTGKFYPF